MKNTNEIDESLKSFAKGKKNIIKQGGRAVIYQRVSTKKQEFGYSPEVQVEICYKWAEAHGYVVVECFKGDHESAKSDQSRTRFKQMLKFVKDKKNRIDAVIVYTTSRFSRTGAKGAISIAEDLQRRGITVFSASSNYDARTPDGEWMQGVEMVNARHENAVKARTTKDSGEKGLRSGHWQCGVPRGYDMVTVKKDQTITVNAEGKLIRKAFKMKVEENLTNEEVRVRMIPLGLNLKKSTWSYIFSNIFYAGYFSHSYLQGEVIKGPQEPLVSLEDFLRINNIVVKAHGRGYETRRDKSYAPLLGSLKCPVCGHNLTASLSTKMRKRYGREIGYYVCSHKGCKCNVPAKKVNADFEKWLDGVALPDGLTDVLEEQLRKAFPILNKESQEVVSAIKSNLTKKENEIETVEYNLATASSAKIREICEKQLLKLEAERDAIRAELEEKNNEILNLTQYLTFGLGLRNNILKLWQISSLSQKKHLQDLVFPDGLVWSKENDDIEPISRNEFLFQYPFPTASDGIYEKGQTINFDNLSSLAPPVGLEPTTL